MKFDSLGAKRIGRVLSGLTLLTGVAVPLISNTTAVSASSTLPPYGTVYAVNQGGNSVTVLSPNGNVVTNIALPSGSNPTSIAVSPDDMTAWVADSGTDSISEIDTTTNRYVQDFPLSNEQPIAVSFNIGSGLLVVTEKATNSNGLNQVVGYSVPNFTAATQTSTSTTSPLVDTAIAQAPDGSAFATIQTDGNSNNTVQYFDPSSFTSKSLLVDSPSPTVNLEGSDKYFLTSGTAGYNYYVAEANSTKGTGSLVCAYLNGQGCPSLFSNGPVALSFLPTAIASSADGNTVAIVGTSSASSTPSETLEVISGLNSASPATTSTQTIVGSDGGAASVTFSADGKNILVGDSTRNVVSVFALAGSSPTLTSTISGVDDPVAFATSRDVVPTPTFTTKLVSPPSSTAPGGTAMFDASGTAQPTSAIASYTWNFDNYPFSSSSFSVTTKTPTLTEPFPTAGQHYVSLTITDEAGSSATSTSQWVGFLDPSGHALAYITDTASFPGSVSVVDTQTNTAIGAIVLQPDALFCSEFSQFGNCGVASPNQIVASHDFSTVYVAATEGEASGVVDVISTATNEVTAAIPTGGQALEVAVSPDGTTLYVVANGPNSFVLETISLTATPPHMTNPPIPLPSGTSPTDMAISPDGSYLGVTLNTSNSPSSSTGEVALYHVKGDVVQPSIPPATIPITTAIPNSLAMSNSSVFVAPSAYNQTSGYSFSSFDIASGNANYTTALSNTGDQPVWITLSPDGSTLQMTVNGSSSSYVAVRSASSGNTIKDVSVPGGSYDGIAYTPDGGATYSVDTGDDSVADVDPYNYITSVPLNNTGPGVTSSIDPAYIAVGQPLPPVQVAPPTTAPTTTVPPTTAPTTTVPPTTAPTTTIPVTTTIAPTQVSQPSSSPTTTVVAQPPSTTQSTVIVPAVHTGKPWSSNLWWLLVATAGLAGLVLLRSGSKRQVGDHRQS
ncbi:MAG: PKD domain-containing protein [Actinomycetota bacterium]|nr:PKD domain-containing protein [Actinomycetota bacterium]